MLLNTKGIVLRSVKYGDTSLITTLFTASSGIRSYLVQGVRGAGKKQNKAAFFQPGLLLELVVYHQPLKNLQRIREFSAAYIYDGLTENVIKNSIVIFSVELLLRLLPDEAHIPALFTFTYDYFIALDKMETGKVANFPLFFILQCSRYLGYEITGDYSEESNHLNLQEGGFTSHPPESIPFTNDEDARLLNRLLMVNDFEGLEQIEMNADMRLRLIDWYIAFLQFHTKHMGNIRSLSILRAILH
jgi:DNA repair protein RecO (recombination protein O)